MNETNNKQQQQASVSASAAGDSGSASPGPYSVAPSHMTDSMSRYGQAVGMGPDNPGRNLAPGSGPPGPPPSALSPWQGYVYGVDPGGRGLAPFPGQPYRPSYQAFPGQYSEPFEQYLGGPLPPDYPINVRYQGDKAAGVENNGMGYAVMDTRPPGAAPSALPPFSTIATHPPSGRGHTPGLKDEMGEFNEGLGARLTRSGSVGAPTPGAEFADALGSRLERSLSREDAYNSSSSLVQYRPWEIGGAGRPDAPPSSHASPTSPSSSYSFAEGFLKFQPGSLMADKGGPSNNGAPNNANSGADGASPGPATVGDDKAWYHAKSGNGGAPSPYSKDSSALPHPPPTSSDKHGKNDGNVSGKSNNNNASSNNNNNNDILSGGGPLGGEPNRPPAPSSVGYSGDGSSGAEDGKNHLGNSYPQYDQRDMLLSFGSPHQTASYDYYPPNPATGGGPWYNDMAKAPNYHTAGRPYSQNGRENVYGNGNPPDRTYQLSPHEKLSMQTTHTPSPPGGGPGGGYQANNAHVPIHAATTTTKKGRGRGARASAVDRVGQVPSVSSSMHSKNNPGLGHDEYGPTSAKQAALASAADDPVAPGDKPKKKKRKRCGECYGCQRKDNCGECAPCRNEKSHQICKMRRCEKLIEKKGNNNNTPAPATPPATHVQPPPPPPPTVNEKIQYLGASAGAGAAWW